VTGRPAWACPDDGAPLERATPGLLCPRCGKEVPARDGVARFSAADRGRGRLLDELLAGAERETTEEAARRLCAGRRYHRRRFTTDWKFLLPLPRGARVLEIGAGFGDDTLELARAATAVHSLVPDDRGGALVARRLREHGIGNVAVGVVGDLSGIPLPAGSIDAIALEDVAAPGFGLTPRTLPAAAAEFARLLAPAGSILVGSRNSYRALPALRALLPPGTLESLNRAVKRDAGRGAGRLPPALVTRRLREAGFDGPQAYAPIPHEQRIEAVVPLEDPAALRYCLDRFLRRNSLVTGAGVAVARVAAALGLLPILLPYRFLLFRRAVPAGAASVQPMCSMRSTIRSHE